jgi:hypothetical protein
VCRALFRAKTLHHAAVTPAADTIAYWRFESGALLSDTAGHASGPHHLLNQGSNNANDSVTLASQTGGSAFLNPIPLTGASNTRAALFTRAESDLFTVPFHPAFATDEFTMEAIVHYKDHGRDQTICGNIVTDGGAELFISGPGFASNKLSILLTGPVSATSLATVIQFGPTLTLNTSYYVAVTVSYNCGRVFFWTKNLTTGGDVVGWDTDLISGPVGIGLPGDFRIGGKDNGEFQGIIDEVRWSNAALGVPQLLASSGSLPVVTIAATDAIAGESGADTGTLTVTRTGATTQPLAVAYQVCEFADFNPVNIFNHLGTSVVIPAGSASANIVLTAFENNWSTDTFRATVVLNAADGYVIGPQGRAVIAILDNEIAQSVEVRASDSFAAETGGNIATFAVTRNGSTATALQVSYSMSGSAASGSDYTAFPGSVTIPAGVNTVLLNVLPVDDVAEEGDETVTITLSASPAYTIDAPSAQATIGDSDRVVTLQATDSSANETGADPGTFTVTRTGSSVNALTVNFSQSRTTATQGTDFAAIGNSVVIPAGSASAVITVTPVDDATSEGVEKVVLTLSSNAAYSIGTPNSGSVFISDNDRLVTVAATDAAANETGPDVGTFTFTRSGNLTGSLAIRYTVAGTADAAVDFLTLTGDATIPSGSASVTVDITPVADAIAEGNETVVMTLLPNAAYTLGIQNQATLTIAEGGVVLPTVSITATDTTAAEAGLFAGQYTIARTGATTAPLIVNYAVSGSAVAGADFIALNGAVTILAGQASATLVLTPLEDQLIEGSETVIVTLTPNAAYSVGVPVSATVTISDNDTSSGVVTFNGNNVNVNFSGLQSGVSYTVQRSYNLQTWTNLSQVTSISPIFSEAKPVGQSKVYYRLRR